MVLIVASGRNRVDLAKIEAHCNVSLSQADAKQVKKVTGFSIGGIPPIGHKHPLRTFIDNDLRQYQTIWAAAGTPHAVFKLTPDILSQLTDGTWLDLAE